jgi:hypothetical protein
MMAEQFLTKTRANRADCIGIGDGIAIERHIDLLALLSARVGPEVVSLFAEPFISRSGDDGQLTIAWYTDLVGRGERLEDLPPEQAARIEARLVSLTRPLTFLGSDEEVGPLVRAALSIGSRSDIWVVEDRPVLVNWGMKPDPGKPEGSLAGFIAPPAPAAQKMAAAPVMPEAPAQQAVAVGPAAVAQAGVAGLPRIAWVPLVVLLSIASLVLIWLLLPWTRVPYPLSAEVEPEAVVDMDAAQGAMLAALVDRKQKLEAALAGAQCRADGQVELPGGLSVDGLPLPPIWEAAVPPDSPPSATEGSGAVLPISPRRLAVPGGETAATLLDQLEAGTVLILAGHDQDLSTGTGFSLGEGFIVTNAHVVEMAIEGGQVFVVHKSFVQPIPAEILRTSAQFEASGTDLALLRVVTSDLPAMALMLGETPKLTRVIAAGFPADVMETDRAFAALLAGEVTEAPDLVVADGIVTSQQTIQLGDGAAHLLFHTAPLAKGNSGGPLVDYCGAVVGVNTFVRPSEFRNLNIALSADDLRRFLEGTPAAPVVSTAAPCQPALVEGGAGSDPAWQGSE